MPKVAKTGYQDPSVLEAEADAELTAARQPPPETESEEVETDQPETSTEPEPDAAAAAAETDTSVAGEGHDDPTKAKPESPAAADTDDLEGLTLEHAQERIRNAQARMHRATQDTADLRRSNAELQARIETIQGKFTTLQSELTTAKAAPPANKPDSEAANNKGRTYASLEAMREDYPTLIDPLLDIAKDSGLFQQQISALTEQVKSLGGRVDEARTVVDDKSKSEAKKAKEAAEKKHYDAIVAKHSDAFKIVQSDEFQGWLDRQPPMYRRTIDVDGSAADCIEVLDKYKKAIGVTRLDTARAAATPATPKARAQPNKTKPSFTRAQIDAMSPAEFAEQEAAIDEAVSEGRVT